jgi:predicted nucleotidyltransferase component of viral defense system
MISFAEKIAALEAEGYADAPARAKLAHDIVLKAMETCGFAKNITIKGGVVMSSITGDIRRATMDMDVDFVRYGLTDEKIDNWILRLNCLDGIKIERSGDIVDLSHQNYNGKRVYLDITDSARVVVSTKLDIGVHVHRQMAQKPMRFAIVLDDNSAMLPANSKEQIFAEKLKSLLRLGARSTRQKDVFDLCYLADMVDRDILRRFIALLVFSDEGMRENDFSSIRSRVHRIFGSPTFMQRLSSAGANWMNEPPRKVVKKILSFLDTLEG